MMSSVLPSKVDIVVTSAQLHNYVDIPYTTKQLNKDICDGNIEEPLEQLEASSSYKTAVLS